MTDVNEADYPEVFQDPQLRREAGEGWYTSGLNRILLGALVARKVLAHEISQGGHNKDDSLLDEYLSQVMHVETLKIQFGIVDPPPLPPESE